MSRQMLTLLGRADEVIEADIGRPPPEGISAVFGVLV
jgi:hypothetical protein